jgi:programmed cell death protein 5
MQSIEEIKNQKREELKKKLEAQKEAEKQQEVIETQVEVMLKQILSPEAKTRLANVKLVNKDLWLNVSQSLIYLVKSGKINRRIEDTELKRLLAEVSGRKKQIKIKRK